MNIPALVEVVNENAIRITELIADEIQLIDSRHTMSPEDRLYALAMFYRAAIIDLETRSATGPVQ